MTPAEHNPQPELGAFERYARIIKLSDLDLPPLPIYEHCDLADKVYEALADNIFEEDNSCVLVRKDENILGYIPFQELLDSEVDPTLQVSALMTKYTKEQPMSRRSESARLVDGESNLHKVGRETIKIRESLRSIRFGTGGNTIGIGNRSSTPV